MYAGSFLLHAGTAVLLGAATPFLVSKGAEHSPNVGFQFSLVWRLGHAR
jgi:hypothetical protein